MITVNLPLSGDGAGNAGWSATDSAATKLYRNGELLGENTDTGFGWFPIPSGVAKYRLTADATRTGVVAGQGKRSPGQHREQTIINAYLLR